MFKSIRDKENFKKTLKEEHEAELKKLEDADRKQRELFESIEAALTATLKRGAGDSPRKGNTAKR